MLPTDLARTTFAPHVGEPFQASLQGESVTLELKEVRQLPSYNPKAPREPFALVFRGQQGWRLPQTTYQFQHPVLGELDIFITQTSDGPDGSMYEAVFN